MMVLNVARKSHNFAQTVPMHLNQQKEQFSQAYVRTIASAAGFDTYTLCVDDDSIDLGIAASGKKMPRRPRLELQLKCTSKNVEDVMRFRLCLKNYNELRCDCLVPRILVVVTVPDQPEKWLTEANHQLVLHCPCPLGLVGRLAGDK